MVSHPLDQLAIDFCAANHFEFAGFVGKGAFKRAYKIIGADNLPLAFKIVDPSSSSVDRTEREIDALRRCDSPRLSRYYSSGRIPYEDGTASYLIEEFFTGGTLSEKLRAESKFHSSKVVQHGSALIEAISELKRLDLVHRDIKPDNIMFRGDDPIPVLTDFGLVRNLGKSSLTPSWQPSGPGTPIFSSPEQLNNDKQLIGWRTDQFALGLVLGVCLTGQHPFRGPGMSDYDAICAVADRKIVSEEFLAATRSTDLGQLVKMLHPWPIGRYGTPAALQKAFT